MATVSGARDCHLVNDTLSAVRLSLGERGSPQLDHRAFPQSPYQIVASYFSSSQVYEWLTLLKIVGPDKFDTFVVLTPDGLRFSSLKRRRRFVPRKKRLPLRLVSLLTTWSACPLTSRTASLLELPQTSSSRFPSITSWFPNRGIQLADVTGIRRVQGRRLRQRHKPQH